MLLITRLRAKGRFRYHQLPLPRFTLATGVSFASFAALSIRTTLAASRITSTTLVAEAFVPLGFVGAFVTYKLPPSDRAVFTTLRSAIRSYLLLYYGLIWYRSEQLLEPYC